MSPGAWEEGIQITSDGLADDPVYDRAALDADLLAKAPERELLDWPLLREATAGSPLAEAFLLVTDRLGISLPC